MKLKLELHRNHKMFLLVAGIVFAGSTAGSWFIWKQCKELDEEAQTLNDQVAAAKQRIAGIDDLEDQVIVLRENVEGYVRVLPSDTEVNDFYRTLGAFSRDAGINITELKPQPNRTKLATSAVFDKAEYKLKLTATYAQFLQFIARLENHERFISIAEVKIMAGEPERKDQPRTDVEMQHTIELSLVTYVYLGDDVGKGVTIPAYDRKKEKLADQIAEARQELALERFQLLSAAGRRDPFVDPRQRGKGKGVGSGPEDQRATLTKIVERIEECNGLLNVMQTAGSVIREMELRVQAINLLAELQTQVDDVNAAGGMTDPALKREWEKKVVPELAKLRARVGQDDAGTSPSSTARLRMQQALVAMEQHWEAGDYAACVKDFELVKSLGGSESADPEIVQMQSRMEELYLSAQTAVEFARKKIEVTGHIVEQGAESIAIINHNVYREGDAIEDDLILLEIHENHLKFEFKGVPLVYDL